MFLEAAAHFMPNGMEKNRRKVKKKSKVSFNTEILHGIYTLYIYFVCREVCVFFPLFPPLFLL